jgi:proteasome accessory factor B
VRPVAQDADEGTVAVPGAVPNVKLQRWIDLIAALLSRHYPASFDELARDVPEYAARLREIETTADQARRDTIGDSLKRTFERDKDELREFGVPIESVDDADEGAMSAYRLRRKDFYLPYLCVALPAGTTSPSRVDRWGYQALTTLTFEPAELQAVVDAAACVRALGDPPLTADVSSALRKLAVDLPIDSAAPSPDEPHVVLPRPRADAAVFELLGDALARRKRVAFDYHVMSAGVVEHREVEPYGLFFLNGHWYLAARDRRREALRTFRLNRIATVKVNSAKAQSADYEIPSTFRLREHASSRPPWELGDGEPAEAVVAFRGASGPTMAASRLGTAVEGSGERRRFAVRRADAFVRWLLSFAGEVVPLSPPSLVEQFGAQVERIATLYVGDSAAPPTSTATEESPRPAMPRATKPWQPKGAAAQLRRILHVVPRLADGDDHVLVDLAASVAATSRRCVATCSHS